LFERVIDPLIAALMAPLDLVRFRSLYRTKHLTARSGPATLRSMAAPRHDPPALHDRALQDLSFIRRTMEGAASFTDVPGWGLVGVGATAMVAAATASRQPSPDRWLLVWILTAAASSLLGAATAILKIRRRTRAAGAAPGSRLFNVPARKFLLSFWPAIVVGALLTLAIVDPLAPDLAQRLTPRLVHHILPGLWLLLYGVAITTAGAYSVRAVPLMGMGFLALGALTLFLPMLNGDVMMALGFGGLQVGFGVHIARRHGG
jgi:hypothetical protein